jgi:uncharacterized protein
MTRFKPTVLTWMALTWCAASAHAQLSQEWRDLVPRVAPSSAPGVLPDEVFDAIREPDDFVRRPMGSASAAWYQAARQGRWAEVLSALKSDLPDVNFAPVGAPQALNLAVNARELTVVRELLKKGASPDLVSSDGFTALGLAAWRGEVHMVKAMLKAGADPLAPSIQGQLPLHLAAAAGHVSVVELLWSVTPHGSVNGQGRHAFSEAAFAGQVAVMARMKELGFAPGIPDANGLHAMHAAVAGRSMPAHDWLVAQGLRVDHAVTRLMWDQWQAGLNPPSFTYP